MQLLKDTRNVHGGYFERDAAGFPTTMLGTIEAPISHACATRCRIAGDRRVGHSPGVVERSMYEFASEVQDTVNEIDFLFEYH